MTNSDEPRTTQAPRGSSSLPGDPWVHVALPLDTAAMRLVERRLGEAGFRTAFLRQLGELEAHLPEVEFLLLGTAPRIDWTRATALRLLQASEPGLDPLFPAQGLAPGVQLAGIGDAHADAAREHVLGWMLAFARDLPRVLEQREKKRARRFPTRPLAGQRLAVVGLGAVGQRVARSAELLGMEVVGVRRHPAPTPAVREVLPTERLGDALAGADYAVFALPQTALTRELLGAQALEALPFRSAVVSVSRPGVLDLAALEGLLRRGQLKAAAVDLPERALPSENHSLWSCPGLFLTNALAAATPNALDPVLERFVENVARVSRGEVPAHAVSREAEY